MKMRARRRRATRSRRNLTGLDDLDEGGWMLIPHEMLSDGDDWLPDYMIGRLPRALK